MSLKLFEVAGTHIFSMSAIVMVLFFVFAIIVVGYLLGKINIKGVSLGTAAIFLVALVVGHFKGVAFGDNGIAAWIADVEAQDAVNFYFKLIQSFGLILFVTSVGLIAGPTFFKNLKKNAKSYVLLGAIIIAAGAGVCALITLLVPDMNSAMSVGLLSGALTSTPAFAAAQEAIGESSPVFKEIAVGHAVAYPFGVIGVVLFVQIVPKVLKANMDEERAKLTSVDTGEESPLKQKKLFEMDKFGLGAFALTVLTGAILGCINIPLGAGSFNLGTTRGPLIMGLIFGSLRQNRQAEHEGQQASAGSLSGMGTGSVPHRCRRRRRCRIRTDTGKVRSAAVPVGCTDDDHSAVHRLLPREEGAEAEPVQQPRFYHRRYDQHTGSGCSHQYQRHTERCKCLRCNLSDRTGTGGSGIAVPHISLNLFETKKPGPHHGSPVRTGFL